MTADNLKILLLAPFGKNGGVAEHAEAISREWEQNRIDVVKVTTQVKGKGAIKGIKQIFNISVRLVRERKNYNLISVQLASNWGFMPGVVAVVVGKMLGKRVAATYHGAEYREFISKHTLLFKYVLKRSDLFLVVSEKTKKYVQQMFPKYDNKTYRIRNGFHSWLFKPYNTSSARKELGLPPDRKILLNVANLENYKGQKYLIESMNIVMQEKKDISLYILGTGQLKESLQTMINKYGFQNNVVLAGGNKPRREIPLWMNACDIFVLPSLRESFGIVLIEAMACGKPVIATINGGSEGIITDERVGLLVKAGDPKELAEAIEKALEMEWNSEYIRMFAEKYEWGKVAEEIFNIYEKSTHGD